MLTIEKKILPSPEVKLKKHFNRRKTDMETMKSLLKKYGKVEASFYGGKVQGVINGYFLEIDTFEYGYTVYLFLNGGIRKFFETLGQLESFLKGLA